MCIKRIILVCLLIFLIVTIASPTISSAYPEQINQSITQYIIDLSNGITSSLGEMDNSIIDNSRGELKLKLLISPEGEIKDAVISESSGNEELDSICLNRLGSIKGYYPLPDELGQEELWITVPIIFNINSQDIRQKEVDLALNKEAYNNQAGMDEAIGAAQENQMAGKIAQEEVKLAELKIREARRALYPTANLSYMETVGRTTGITEDFTDREYKLKFEYPLYYGWRLRYAVSQAISNTKAAKNNYEKVLQDLRIEVEVAFYSYLMNNLNLNLQKDLLKDAEGIHDIARKRYDLELITKSEFLQIDSQFKQIAYQVAASQNDLSIARLTLAQAMNVGDSEDLRELIDIDVDFNADTEHLDTDVTLEQCIDLACRYRPDLKSKEYMVEFNDYEQKIQQSKDQLRVDLTGSVGRSGGAFESESLTMGQDWFFGLKFTKPLGANTVSTSYTKDKTSEKHGQTSRIESESKAVELGILDNLQTFSDKEASRIALYKAKDELHNTKDAIYKEVKESYLNYRKGLIQIKSGLKKISYREEELKVAKMRAELNEIPLSELLKAHMSLTDERLFYVESLGSLYQSMARLNKATGYVLFLDDESFRVANADRPTS